MKNNPRPKTSSYIRMAILLLSILGAADAFYLWMYKLSSNDKMCLGNGGCATVNYSPFSEIYGIPVALLGFLAYILITAILILEKRLRQAKDNGPLAIFGLGLVGFLFSIYLTYIEYFIIHAVCPFCIGSAFIMTAIFILASIRLVIKF